MGILKWLLGSALNGSHHGNNSKHGYNKHGVNNYHDLQEQRQNSYQTNEARCVKCNSMNTDDAKFCQQCGNSMLPAKCIECNATLNSGSKFCSQCGKSQS